MRLAPALPKLPLLVIFAALGLGGCAKDQIGAQGPEALAQSRAAVSGPAGYLALTLDQDFGAFLGEPTLLLDVANDAGDVEHLKVTDKSGTFPVVFVLPAGHWRLSHSTLHIPGGRINGQEFIDSLQPLGLEQSVQPFALEADHLVHLAQFKLVLKQALEKGRIQYATSALVSLVRPDPSVWAPYKDLLAKSSPVYEKKSRLGSVSFLPWSLAAGRSHLLPDSEIKAVTHARQRDVDACYIRNSPHAHGRVEVKYVVAPTGAVHEASLASSTLKQPKTEACLVELVKTMKFPKTPDDDFETWTGAWRL